MSLSLEGGGLHESENGRFFPFKHKIIRVWVLHEWVRYIDWCFSCICSDRASQDQTAATWGGSTNDNLESIGENDDAREQDEDQVDDGTLFTFWRCLHRRRYAVYVLTMFILYVYIVTS